MSAFKASICRRISRASEPPFFTMTKARRCFEMLSLICAFFNSISAISLFALISCDFASRCVSAQSSMPKPNPVAMSGEEVDKFIEVAIRGPHGLMFELAFYLGARPCEYLGLKWADLNAKQSETFASHSHTKCPLRRAAAKRHSVYASGLPGFFG
jgi:integrase